MTVLFVYLDGFKAVNDTGGHVAGDAVLVAVAERLRAVVPAQDTVARVGGDEFVVLLEDVVAPADAPWLPDAALRTQGHEASVLTVAGRVREAVAGPMVVDGRPYRVTARIGIARAQVGDRPDAVLGHADRAMYTAKSAGGDRYVARFPTRPGVAPALADELVTALRPS